MTPLKSFTAMRTLSLVVVLALLCMLAHEAQAQPRRMPARFVKPVPAGHMHKSPKAPPQLAPKPVYPKGGKGVAPQPDLTRPLPKHKQVPKAIVKDSVPQRGIEKRTVTHPSGRRDIYQSKTREPNGDIGKQHSHIVLNKARQVEVAKTMDRKTVKDSGKHIPKR